MFRSKHSHIHAWLSRELTPFQQRLNCRLIDRALTGFRTYERRIEREQRRHAAMIPRQARKQWEAEISADRRRPRNAPLRTLVEFLRLEVQTQLTALNRLAAGNAEFRKTIARVLNNREAERVLLDYGTELGATWWGRNGDRRALRRWLNEDAMQDRYLRRRGETELYALFLLSRLGIVVSKLIPLVHRAEDAIDLWERLGMNSLLEDVLIFSSDARLQVAALDCLGQSLQGVAADVAYRLVSDPLHAFVQRAASDPTGHVWLQCASLRLLHKSSQDLFVQAVAQRLSKPLDGDDLFVRRHALRLVAQHAHLFSKLDDMWHSVMRDPSDAVRQQLAAIVWQLPAAKAIPLIEQLATEDTATQVRAAVLVQGVTAARNDLAPTFLQLLDARIGNDPDAFVRRAAMHVSVEWLRAFFKGQPGEDGRSGPDWRRSGDVLKFYQRKIIPSLRRIQSSASDVASRRWAAAAVEQIWVQLDPQARQLAERLAGLVANLRPARSRAVPRPWLQGLDPDLIGRTMAVLTQEDFGLELSRGFGGARISRSPIFGFRLWRSWFEFWHPSTDKRQAHRHTVGRLAKGTLRAPSRILGELSQTKVPGEPLVIASDGTWRPFLPLPDDFISVLNQSILVPRDTQLYSSEGVTEISVSPNPWRRWMAALRLTLAFPRLAESRNWDPKWSSAADDYLVQFQRAGFRVRFRPHSPPSEAATDTTVTQFFPAAVILATPAFGPLLWNLISDYASYFGSAFENTLGQLVCFTTLALALFMGKHAVSNLLVYRGRRSIPLSIGGWGTRGKSGTERLKSAVVSALGHPLISKTTGCEAMFIQAHALGDPLEIPLYRPADKATIWEQSNLLRFASRLKPSVFLWECMALSPDYVDVLQRQWTHDDLATITNTYPDHEDVQGPSGYDVARTITGFVPRRARVLTTEQQMRPLIRASCERVGTSLRGIGWLESGLICDDFVDRFPYREHPDNIALVAALAEELGCSFDFAIKAMADYLIPDLGVLKTHPIAQVEHCQLEFTNGMSANERFGCLGNWSRLKFDQQDPYGEPAVWISTVVNNRADRVARSRVFAHVIVNDVQADRHFLIGGNLKGLQGFIWEAWDDYQRSVTLRRAGSTWNPTEARQSLERLARRFRVPYTRAQVSSRIVPVLRESLEEPSVDIEGLAEELSRAPDRAASRLDTLGVSLEKQSQLEIYLGELNSALSEYEQLREKIESTQSDGPIADLEQQVRSVLKKWFARKLVVVENYHATGDQVIQRIVEETPPGYLNRIMGLQNIKGTGLDFVYRFHAWDAVDSACGRLSSRDQAVRQQALNELAAMPGYGLLCHVRLSESLHALKRAQPPILAEMQLQVDEIERKLHECQVQYERTPGSTLEAEHQPLHPGLAWAVAKLEQWMEVPDSVRRRQKADQIYRDLVHGRIGRVRAVDELRKLNQRQKGGWLVRRLTDLRG